MNSTFLSKPKIGILAAFIYTAIMGFGMFYMKTFMGITYGDPSMLKVFWPILILLNVINAFFIVRYFGWQEVGFGKFNPKQLLWFVPFLSLLAAKWVMCLSALASASLDASQWQLLALVGFTTLLVGLGEETMFRGILLHGFLSTKRVLLAMLVSAMGFSLLHSVNIFGGHPWVELVKQLGYTFLWGFLFAPLMIKFNNIWPLIIFHWLWDFVQFAGAIAGALNVYQFDNLQYPIEIIVGAILWISVKKDHARVVEQSEMLSRG